ncbi:MAG: M1 family metallopeptidase [Bacteroidetes bacterium]|nr:M1 family metallopeptidase [Bacteroidota bacterium]
MKVKKNNKILVIALSVAFVSITIIAIVAFLNWQFVFTFSDGLSDIKEKISSESYTDIDVLSYHINLELNSDEQTINGDVLIKLKTKQQNQNRIVLNFYDNFRLSTVTINGKKTDYTYDDNLLILNNTRPFGKEIELRIIYSGTPKNVGLGSFNFGKYKNKSLVYSLNEPVFASTWFPCNDDVTDKAFLKMSITNDSSMVSISNGKLIDMTIKGSKKTYTYVSEYPISTYLVALYSGQYKNFKENYISVDSKDTMLINYYVTEDKLDEAKIDFSIHVEAIKIFSELFGEYPFLKDGYGVAQFLWKYGAMEHQTITGIGSDYISGLKFHTSILVHELAHHWWGNAVSPKSWKDIWLNEGFSTYSEALYYEKKTGVKSLQSTMLSFKNDFEDGPLYNPGLKMFSRLVYDKGAWVLHMIRRELGDEIFFNVLRNYFIHYKYKNANTNDFIKICEKYSGKNLSVFFDQWVYKGVGIINLDYSWVNKNNVVKLKIKQTQGSDIIYRFPLDVEIKYSDGEADTLSFSISQKETELNIPVRKKIMDLVPDPESWLLATFNPQNIEK